MKHIDNHVELGLDRLLEQDRDKLNIQLLCKVFLSRYQMLENMLSELNHYIKLDNAYGATLDNWGANFSVARQERGDNSYLQAIYTQILVNNAKGTVGGILSAINMLYSPTSVYLKEFDAYLQLYIREPKHLENIAQIMPAIVAAGVGYSVIYETGNCAPLATFGLVESYLDVDNAALLLDNDEYLIVSNSEIILPDDVFILSSYVQLVHPLILDTEEGEIALLIENEEEEESNLALVDNVDDYMIILGSDLAIAII